MRQCKTCKKTIKRNFTKHVKSCSKKKTFTTTKTGARSLGISSWSAPIGKSITKKEKMVAKRGSVPVNEVEKAWRRVKRRFVLMAFNHRIRERAFRHFAARLYCCGKGFSKEYLNGVINRN